MNDSGTNFLQSSVICFCARAGRDRLLVQGAGGNVSWKDADTLWIKASGTWLAEAGQKDIFVPVDLRALKKAADNGDFATRPESREASELKPSIETMLHALMPHPIVVHLHAVEILACLVRETVETEIETRIGTSLKWAVVPYRKPGADLAKAVYDALSLRPDADILFLRNHGVVIGGKDIPHIEALLRDVTEKCRFRGKNNIGIGVPEKGEGSYIPIPDEDIQQLALNPEFLSRLDSSWALYPDHVVFLGQHAHVFKSWESFQAVQEDPPELVFIEGSGVFAKPGFSEAKIAQMRCYADVLMREPLDAKLVTLSDRQVAELLNWDAEHYRQKMSRA
jgi:rhamnose utilization protein RhaD (predicted bifunctional aldolase and dehydrogenase)